MRLCDIRKQAAARRVIAWKNRRARMDYTR